MSLDAVAAAVQRARHAFTRKPGLAVHDDSTATTRWQGGTRCVSRHANGHEVATDMPPELGGKGDQVTPGWLFRAGLASCTATTLATHAAAEGLELTLLEVRVDSRSDARGYLAMPGADGTPVAACPGDMRMHVRIAAAGVGAAALRAFVARFHRCSPIPQAVIQATPIALEVETA